MSAVDVHAHVVVPELAGPRSPDVFAALDRLLEPRPGIDHVVLSAWVGLLGYELEPAEGLERCRLHNDGLARLRSERVSVLGTVPLQDPELAAAELVSLVVSSEFVGVEITSSVGGTYLGDPRFEPFWEAAERTGALVFVHPTTRGFGDAVFGEHYLENLVGNPMETTLTAAHMVLRGVMERHPDLKVLLAHGGGALLMLRGRLRRGVTAGLAGADLAEPPDLSIGRFLFDTITHDPALLRMLVQTVGSDRVLLGSDFPFKMADPEPVRTVRSAGLSDREEEAILSGNAARLLRVPG